ncbi:hypothetical protein NC652_019438 [Populus alba x Populus x berolinensis]|uniref:Uncharacterized protein n=1 Tax=Populus alba x Populus x berolinensis TaxID=444605 RepID=A0AAD6Q9V3_9ROSI|nr:hypothetical protein NC652_019438 [Populus alba x Populus x berolinensis]KAJ6984351.1 hypothetical protein NC653_022573 [Populus alba x Populus x berolinensis]
MKSLKKPRDRDEDEGDGRRRSRETGTKTKKTRSAAWALGWDLGKKRDCGLLPVCHRGLFHNFQCFIFNFRPSQELLTNSEKRYVCNVFYESTEFSASLTKSTRFC